MDEVCLFYSSGLEDDNLNDAMNSYNRSKKGENKMDYALKLILKQINQKIICLVDGEEQSFANGDEAISQLEKEHRHYSPAGISAKDNAVILALRDITEELKTRNEEFISEHKKQFGYEPNLFDGV